MDEIRGRNGHAQARSLRGTGRARHDVHRMVERRTGNQRVTRTGVGPATRRRYPASGSASKIPNVLPSVSRKYPCQHTPGTANLGKATWPPAPRIFAAVASKLATSMEQMKALVPCSGESAFTGRFSKPPRGPSVSIRQYSIGNPSALLKLQPNISR